MSDSPAVLRRTNSNESPLWRVCVLAGNHWRLRAAACLTLLSLLASPGKAEVRLPRILGEGAILQRDTTWSLWGKARPGEKISVRLDGRQLARTTARTVEWSVTLPEQPVGGPHRIEVKGDNLVVLNDVYFGDVWLTSGQSNMELPISRVAVNYPGVVEGANLPLIRHFRTPKEADFSTPRSDFSGGEWKRATSKNVARFSAVGFFFAKHVHEHNGVPIALIDNSYGGSAVESWLSEKALEGFPEHLATARQYQKNEYLDALKVADKKKNDSWYRALNARDLGLKKHVKWFADEYDSSGWQKISVPGVWQGEGAAVGAHWFRKSLTLPASAAGRAGLLVLGRIVDADTAYLNGHKVGNTTYQYPPRRYSVPEGVLRAGENTVAVRVTTPRSDGQFVPDKPYRLEVGAQSYPLAGKWQYRLGARSERLAGDQFTSYKAPLGFYNALLAPLLNVKLKGVLWYQGETNTGNPAEYTRSFPALIRDWRKQFGQGTFPFLFVQLANFQAASSQPTESGWAETREAQRQALQEPNTAMVVAIDAGEWNDIHPLNKKALGDRLALAARKLAYGEDVVYSGPAVRNAITQGRRVIVSFDHVGSGLTHSSARLHGFAVAGPDGKFVWAVAKISGEQVVVSSPRVHHPVRVRYAWADNPDKANLYNREGLPASPFEVRTTSRK